MGRMDDGVDAGQHVEARNKEDDQVTNSMNSCILLSDTRAYERGIRFMEHRPMLIDKERGKALEPWNLLQSRELFMALL